MNILKISMNRIVKWILYISLFLNFFIAEFRVPNALFYINDLLLMICVTVSLCKNRWGIFKKIQFSLFYFSVLLLVSIIIIGVVLNLVPVQLILWGARNTFRGIFYLIVCIIYLDNNDVFKLFDLFVKIQVLNFAVGLYQYFILGLKQDLLGGLFGHGNGNALCIFCVIVCSYTMFKYFNLKKGFYKMLFCYASSFVLAAFAEEKLLMIELIIVFIMCMVLSKKSVIKLIVIPIAVVIIQQSIVLFDVLFPGSSKILFNLSSIQKYMSASWEGSYFIPRLGAFSYISTNIFRNNVLKNLFGFGMGNCDTSNFSLFQSDFYQRFGYMNYRWIFSQWTILETGILGFLAFVFLFLSIIYYMVKNRKYCSNKDKTIVDSSIVIAIICILTMWFNITLKVDTAYIAYFAVAAGIICIKSKN